MYGINIALTLYQIGIIAYLLNGGQNQIMLVISLELLLLSVGILLVNISYNLDDQVGSNITLLILPLAGAESAVALALLVAYYPIRGSVSLR